MRIIEKHCLMSVTLEAFEAEKILNLIKTIEFTIKLTNPEADSCEIYEHVIMVAAAMGADIAIQTITPDRAARQFGDTLTENIIRLMKVTENESTRIDHESRTHAERNKKTVRKPIKKSP